MADDDYLHPQHRARKRIDEMLERARTSRDRDSGTPALT